MSSKRTTPRSGLSSLHEPLSTGMCTLIHPVLCATSGLILPMQELFKELRVSEPRTATPGSLPVILRVRQNAWEHSLITVLPFPSNELNQWDFVKVN
jgi:hypothetical protein